MDSEITAEELGQIIRAARVVSTDFSEEQIQSLSYAWQGLVDSGFLDAVWGMTRLQQEQGISCSEALDANKQLLKQKGKFERDLATLKEKIMHEQNKHTEATKLYQQWAGKINAAKEELQAIQSDIQKEQEGLSSFRKKSESEKKQIERDIERSKKKAGVATEDIVSAGQLKAEVEKSGFNFETMLKLVQEFSPYRDAKDRLTEALKTEQSLTQYITTLEQKSAEQKRSIRVEIDELTNRKGTKESEVKHLEGARRLLEISLARLHADLDEEQSLRQFYIHYSPLSALLEYLVTWRQVYFLRCDNPMCTPFAGITHFWTDRPVRKCLHCGLSMVGPDPELFRLLNVPEGTEFTLKLG